MKIQVVRPSQIPEELFGKVLGFDIETEDLPIQSDICLIQVYSTSHDTTFIVPIKAYHKDSRFKELDAKEMTILKSFLSSIKVCGHNLQFDLARIKFHFGVQVTPFFDTFLMARVFQLKKQSLKDMYQEFISDNYEIHFDDLKLEPPFRYDLDDYKTLTYSARDAIMPVKLFTYFKSKIQDSKYRNTLRLEMQFLSVAIAQQSHGIYVDQQELSDIKQEVSNQYELHKSQFCEKWNLIDFKPNRSADVSSFVSHFGETSPLRTKGGKESWSSEALNMIQMQTNNLDLKEGLCEIQSLKKEFSTNNSFKNVDKWFQYGPYLYPTVEQIAFDASGRVYHSNPSLTSFPKQFRKLVKPQKGKKFLYLDLSAAELYIMAYRAKEESLLKAFREGQDVHTAVAKKFMGLDEVSKEQREIAKVLSFGTIYGSAGGSIARELNISYEDGQKMVSNYLETFPAIKFWIQSTIQSARSLGYTTTITGRIRMLEGYTSNNEDDKSKADRQAVNTAIQSSCGDFYKMMAIKAYSEPNVFPVTGVFDSLLIEVPEDYTEDQALSLVGKLTDFSDIFPDFKFNCKWGFGYTWYEAYSKC